VSSIVAAAATVHAPFITGLPGLAPANRRQRVYDGFDYLREYVEGANPDVIVAFSSEHITNFLSTNVPAFCVGVGVENPSLPEFNLPEVTVRGDRDLATGLVEYGYQAGFDLSHSQRLLLDHGTGLPLRFITPNYEIPVVVVMQNTIWGPMHGASRAFDAGKLLADYLAQDGQDKRVALLATGGISHWVGNSHHGDINQEFDEWFLEQVATGQNETLRSMTQGQIDEAGDGANEVRNWIALAGAVTDRTPRVVIDETFVPGWNVSAYQVVWD
jgi:aromatic ring-opening dioxygenase catalytic subunit (LigB family)